MNDDAKKFALCLNEDESLVLYEWLASNEEPGTLTQFSDAEQQVLWKIEAQLEKQLSVIFASDYKARVLDARARLLR